MVSVDRSRAGCHRAAVRWSIDAPRLVCGGAVNEHFISIEFEAAVTKRWLAGVSTLINLSMSEQLINPRTGRGRGRFCPPLMFFRDIKKLTARFSRAFQYLTRNERRIF